MRIKTSGGFSLMEVVVTVAIFSFLVAGLLGLFTSGNRFWQAFQTRASLQQELRRAMFMMTKELREAQGILVESDPTGAVTLNFERPHIGTVAYVFSPQGEHAHQMIRRHNAETKILANDISFASFDYQNNSIWLDLTAALPSQGTTPSLSWRLKEKVTLR